MGNKKVLSLVLAGIIGAGSCLPAMAGNPNGDDAVNPNGDGTASISVGLSGEENKSSQTTEEQKEVPPPTKKRKIEKSDKDSSNKETSVMEDDNDDDDDSETETEGEEDGDDDDDSETETEGEEDGIDFSWMNADYKDDNGKPNYNQIKELFSANIRFTSIQPNIDYTICNALIKVLYMHNRKTLSDKSKSTNEHQNARKKTITEYEKITKDHNECLHMDVSGLMSAHVSMQISALYRYPKTQNNLLSILVKLMDMAQEENKSIHTQLDNDIEHNNNDIQHNNNDIQHNNNDIQHNIDITKTMPKTSADAQEIINAAQDEAQQQPQQYQQQMMPPQQPQQYQQQMMPQQQYQQFHMQQQQPQQYQPQQMMPQQQYQQFHMLPQQYQQFYMQQQP